MRTAGLTQAYRVNLTALALMALFTGGFLVFSTLALQAARRRQEFALLRALGLTAGGVRAFLAIEGALLGLAGAVAGTALGLVASRAMLERFGYDLGAGFFSRHGRHLLAGRGRARGDRAAGRSHGSGGGARGDAAAREARRRAGAQGPPPRPSRPPGGWARPLALARRARGRRAAAGRRDFCCGCRRPVGAGAQKKKNAAANKPNREEISVLLVGTLAGCFIVR